MLAARIKKKETLKKFPPEKMSVPEVVLDCPADGVGALITEIDSYADLALGSGCRGANRIARRGGLYEDSRRSVCRVFLRGRHGCRVNQTEKLCCEGSLSFPLMEDRVWQEGLTSSIDGFRR